MWHLPEIPLRRIFRIPPRSTRIEMERFIQPNQILPRPRMVQTWLLLEPRRWNQNTHHTQLFSYCPSLDPNQWTKGQSWHSNRLRETFTAFGWPRQHSQDPQVQWNRSKRRNIPISWCQKGRSRWIWHQELGDSLCDCQGFRRKEAEVVTGSQGLSWSGLPCRRLPGSFAGSEWLWKGWKNQSLLSAVPIWRKKRPMNDSWIAGKEGTLLTMTIKGNWTETFLCV